MSKSNFPGSLHLAGNITHYFIKEMAGKDLVFGLSSNMRVIYSVL